MKFNKKMFNKELRSIYHVGKLLAYMLRKNSRVNFYRRMMDKPSVGKSIDGIDCSEMMVPSNHGGPDIRVRIFKPKQMEGPLPGMLFFHGGGYIVGTPEQFLDIIKKYIDKRPCIVIAPDYRKAINDPFPNGFNDCYDTLCWSRDQSGKLGIDQNRLMVAGHSAGGGLAVAVALKARDTGDVALKLQIPVYPMLDDRQKTESMKTFEGVPMWDSRNTAYAWDLYLHRLKLQGDKIPAYASPARETDYSNLPPAISFFGDMEPFRDEAQSYLEQLKASGIPVKYKIVKGAFHGFEMAQPKASISKEAESYLLEAYADYYDQYLN
ncbi:MAG: alpha/beta hydrolase [Cyclobacteriaceae bacterium]